MFLSKINVSYLIIILLNVFINIQISADEAIVEYNNIKDVQKEIRNSINNLFSGVKIELKHSPKLEQNSTIYNFSVSNTLQNWENLKEINKLTRVALDNDTILFIAPINEVVHGEDKGTKSSHINTDDSTDITHHTNEHIDEIRYLKNKFYDTDAKTDILNYLNNHNSKTHDASENFTDNEFWKPNLRRIYNGMPTGIKRFPFVASIKIFGKFHCAGSIIHNNLVITSASCLNLAWENELFRDNPSFLSVQVGSDAYDEGGDNIPAKKIIFHPEYNPETLHNNLAIIKIQRALKYTERVKKINYDKYAVPISSIVHQIIVIGWGSKDKLKFVNNVFSNQLTYAELDSYPLEDCQKQYSRNFVIDTHFCAGYLNRGACNRDTGGPGIADGILMGIINFGSPLCGPQASPTVFTKLGYYADWISETIEQEKEDVEENVSTDKTTHNLDTSTNTQPLRFFQEQAEVTTSTKKVTNKFSKIKYQEKGLKDISKNIFSSDELNKELNKNLSKTSNIRLAKKQTLDPNKKETQPESKNKISQVSNSPSLVHSYDEYSDENSEDRISEEEKPYTKGFEGITILNEAKQKKEGIIRLTDDSKTKEIIKPSNDPSENTVTDKGPIKIRIVSSSRKYTKKKKNIATTPSSASKEADNENQREEELQNNPDDEHLRIEKIKTKSDDDNQYQEDGDVEDKKLEDKTKENLSSATLEFQDLTFREKLKKPKVEKGLGNQLSVSLFGQPISIVVNRRENENNQ